jgi:hypothetical protein
MSVRLYMCLMSIDFFLHATKIFVGRNQKCFCLTGSFNGFFESSRSYEERNNTGHFAPRTLCCSDISGRGRVSFFPKIAFTS